MSVSASVDVLLVEDNPGDVYLAKEAIAEAGLNYRLRIAETGLEALQIVRKCEIPLPELMILDLNLPVRSGHEVLSELHGESSPFLVFPIAILTGSTVDYEVCDKFSSPRCRYFIKPPRFTDLVAVMRDIDEFRKAAASSSRTDRRT